MSGTNSSEEGFQRDKKRLGTNGFGYMMLSEKIHSLLIHYIANGRSRAPPELELGELLPSFQDGAKTDRRALQSKFKSWSKRMEIQEKGLVLACSGKMILPRERCKSVIMDLHLWDHCDVDELVKRVQEKYTWSRKNFGMDWDIVAECLTENCFETNCLQKLHDRLSSIKIASRPASKQSSNTNFQNSEEFKGYYSGCSEDPSINYSANEKDNAQISEILPRTAYLNFEAKSTLRDNKNNLIERLGAYSLQNVENKISLRPQLYPNGLPLSPILKEKHIVVKSKKPVCVSAIDLLKAIEKTCQQEETLSCIKEEKTQFLAVLDLVPLKFCPRKKILTKKQRLAIKEQMMKRRLILQRRGIGRYNLRHIKVKKQKTQTINREKLKERLQTSYYKRWSSRRQKQRRLAGLPSACGDVKYSLRKKSTKKRYCESDSDIENDRKRIRKRSQTKPKKQPAVVDLSSSEDEQQVPSSPRGAFKTDPSGATCEDQKPWSYDLRLFTPVFYPHLRPNAPLANTRANFAPTQTNTFTKFSSNVPRMATFVNASGRPMLPRFERVMTPTFIGYASPCAAKGSGPVQPSPVIGFWDPGSVSRNSEHANIVRPWNVGVPPPRMQLVRLPNEAKYMFLQAANGLPATMVRMPEQAGPPRLQMLQGFSASAEPRFRHLAPKPPFTSADAVVTAAAVVVPAIVPNPSVLASGPPAPSSDDSRVGANAVTGADQSTGCASKEELEKSKAEAMRCELKTKMEKSKVHVEAMRCELKAKMEKYKEELKSSELRIRAKNKIAISWNEKARNLSRLIQRLKSNMNASIFHGGKEKTINKVSAQLEAGLILVKGSRKSLNEWESLIIDKKDDGSVETLES